MPRRSDMIRSVFRVACVVRRRGCRPSGNRRRRVPCQQDIRSRKHRLSRSIHYLEETVFRSEPHPSFPILRIFIQAKALAPGDPDSMAYQAAQAADTVRRDPRTGAPLRRPAGVHRVGHRRAAIARVVERVAAGGHDVPDDKILSRVPRTPQNLTQALEFVDHAFLFDNSSAKEPFRFVAEFINGVLVRRAKRRPKRAVSLLTTFSKEER